MMTKMKIRKQGKRWWIVGRDQPIGPYDTRAEAEADRRGMARFDRYCDEPGFITSERQDDES